MSCALALLCAACSVYENGLVGTGAPLDDNGGSAGKVGATGGDASAGSTAGGTSNAGTAGNGSATPGGVGGSPPATAGDAGAKASGEAGAGNEGGAAPIVYELEALDDMEDGNAFVLSEDDRNGHWDVSNDGSASGSQTPPAANFAMAELLDPARPDSLFAAYTQGSGFKGWGATMTVSMITWPVYAETPTYDASAYAGISFYAKAGVGSDLTLRLRFVGAQTDDRGLQCTPGGGVTTACYDHFFKDVKLSQAWQRYDVHFADFKQAGVGMKFASIDVATMYALEFFFPGRSTVSGNAFELWVDDLSFILK